jgi:glycosyltransferase involved in cell wall biosynthesis
MNNKKLTIITINYNNNKGLLKTFESIKNQTWLDFEYIVIDGGSTDGGKELIENNAQINYWVSEKDSGVYNAMNKGIRAATGDYIIFMNSGDFFYDNDVLEKVAKHFDSNISIFYGNAHFLGKEMDKIIDYPDKLSFSFFTHTSLCHQATFIKKDLFDKIFYYNENYKIVSDWEFFAYSICIKKATHQHLKQIICTYDLNGISSQEKAKVVDTDEREQVMNTHFSMFKDDYENYLCYIPTLNNKYIKKLIEMKNNKKYKWIIIKNVVKILSLFKMKDN